MRYIRRLWGRWGRRPLGGLQWRERRRVDLSRLPIECRGLLIECRKRWPHLRLLRLLRLRLKGGKLLLLTSGWLRRPESLLGEPDRLKVILKSGSHGGWLRPKQLRLRGLRGELLENRLRLKWSPERIESSGKLVEAIEEGLEKRACKTENEKRVIRNEGNIGTLQQCRYNNPEDYSVVSQSRSSITTE